MNDELLIVLSGPAGSGKDTVLEKLLADGGIAKTVSATTRAIRPSEADGKDYYFWSRERFEAGIAAGEFIEHTEYAGNLYGTLRSEISRINALGKSAILKIEVEGGTNVRRLFPDAVMIFLIPPSAAELVRRLRKRGTETPEQIEARLSAVPVEIDAALELYDYTVVNDGIDGAVADVACIVAAEKMRTARRTALLNEVKKHVNSKSF